MLRKRRIAATARLRADLQFKDHRTAAFADLEKIDFPNTGIRLFRLERYLIVERTKPSTTGQPEAVEVHERNRGVFLEPIAAACG